LGRSTVIRLATGVKATDVASGASVASRYRNSKRERRLQIMKKNNGKKSNLQQLADALDIMDPKDFSDELDTTKTIKNKRGNREIIRRSQSSVRPASYDAESFELMVLPCGDTSEIFKLMGYLDMMLHDADSYGDILHTSFNSDCSVTVTMQISPTKFKNLVLKLSALSGVEKIILSGVEEITEELEATGTLMGRDQKPKVKVLSSVDSDRRFQVLMKEREAVHQEEPVAVSAKHK